MQSDCQQEDKWYVVQTKSNQEDIAAFNLSRLELQIINPKLKEERMAWGCLKTVTKPLFAGYIFAKFNAPKYLHTIQYTRGVKQILRFGMTILPVEDEIIQNIQARLTPDGYVEIKKKSLIAGTQVTIDEGPFNGLNGIFEREMSDRKRVVILLDIMGVRAQVVTEKQFLSAAA